MAGSVTVSTTRLAIPSGSDQRWRSFRSFLQEFEQRSCWEAVDLASINPRSELHNPPRKMTRRFIEDLKET
jgi:hypothetical protein